MFVWRQVHERSVMQYASAKALQLTLPLRVLHASLYPVRCCTIVLSCHSSAFRQAPPEHPPTG
jgi:hypothetical protein